LEGQPPGVVLQLIAGRGRKLVEGDCALVRTLSADGKVLVLRAAAWRHPNDALLLVPPPRGLLGGSFPGSSFVPAPPPLWPAQDRPYSARVRPPRRGGPESGPVRSAECRGPHPRPPRGHELEKPAQLSTAGPGRAPAAGQ